MFHVALISLIALLPVSALTREASLPLFTAFGKFCVDTSARPEMVNAAVKAAGARPHRTAITSPEMSAKSGAPFPLTLWTWEIEIGGHKMWVSDGTSYPSRKFANAKNADFDSCSITSFAKEDASVKAIQNWLRIKPDTVNADKLTPDFVNDFYSWAGEIRPSRSDGRSTNPKLRVWSLVLMREPKGASLQLRHTFSEAEPKSAR